MQPIISVANLSKTYASGLEALKRTVGEKVAAKLIEKLKNEARVF